MSSITLYYFGIEGSRGGAIRAALVHGGVEFEDKFVTWDEYVALRDAGTLPPGLPCIEVDGKKISQSLAILRFAGKKSGLYPTDGVDAMMVDEAMDICQDIMTKCPQDPDPEVKKAKREEFAAGKMKDFFGLIDKQVTGNGGSFVLGSEISIADLVVYYIIALIRSGSFDHVDAAYTDAWPALCALEKAVEASDVMTKYKKYFAEKKK